MGPPRLDLTCHEQLASLHTVSLPSPAPAQVSRRPQLDVVAQHGPLGSGRARLHAAAHDADGFGVLEPQSEYAQCALMVVAAAAQPTRAARQLQQWADSWIDAAARVSAQARLWYPSERRAHGYTAR